MKGAGFIQVPTPASGSHLTYSDCFGFNGVHY